MPIRLRVGVKMPEKIGRVVFILLRVRVVMGGNPRTMIDTSSLAAANALSSCSCIVIDRLPSTTKTEGVRVNTGT